MSEDNESIFIPLRSHDEAVVLYSDILPDNVQEIIDLLRYEEVKLDIWLQIAVTYYKNQKFDQFLKILNNAATQRFIFDIIILIFNINLLLSKILEIILTKLQFSIPLLRIT